METSVLEVLEVCILLLWRGGQLARLMAAGGEHSQFVSGFGPVSRSGGCVWMRTATGQHLKCLTSPTPETSLATKESWNRPKASRLALPRRRPLSLSLSLGTGGSLVVKKRKTAASRVGAARWTRSPRDPGTSEVRERLRKRPEVTGRDGRRRVGHAQQLGDPGCSRSMT